RPEHTRGADRDGAVQIQALRARQPDRVEKNKDYFVRGLPYLDGVRQYILVGGPTQLAAAKAGRIMLWDAWPPMKRTQAEELQRARTDVDIYQASINTIFLL